MRYFYNEETNSFVVYTNFIPKQIPQGFHEVTKEQYNEMTKIEHKKK